MKAFDNQPPDLLVTIAATLKAGHSFRQAVQSVVDEGAEPAAKEFNRVLTETRLGRPMDEALADTAKRVGSKNFMFVITAVTIQRQIGGSLAGLFDMVAETVRQRQQFARKIRGLTAQGRMSAYVLVGLPFFIALAVTVLNPTYMAPLYGTSTGRQLIVVGLVMIAFGTVILEKNRFVHGVAMALLLLAMLILGCAVYLAGQVATYGTRQQQVAVKRAAGYGRARVSRAALERVNFRERVVTPSVKHLAAITLRLNRKATVDGSAVRLLAAGLSSRISPVQYLALKAGLAIGGVVFALVVGLGTAPAATILLIPMFAVLGFLGPNAILTLATRGRRERIRSRSCRTRSTCSPSRSRPASASTAR